MKEKITALFREYINNYEKKDDIASNWGEPLVGFADAHHPYILAFRETISPAHLLPSDLLESASIVIAYFVPFTRELAHTNAAGDQASPEWAQAYEETNGMFRAMNEYMIKEISEMGFHAAVTPEAYTFDQEKLISNWSQRHIAYAAGLGTFGINNMLITTRGCCGRYGTIVTDLPVEPDQIQVEEYCIYKKNGRCGICVSRCPSGALTVDGFNRNQCYRLLQKNAERYTEFGCSYFDETGHHSNSIGSEVCGKCTVNVPCAFMK